MLRSAQQAIRTVAAISTARALHRDQWTTWWPGRKCMPNEEFAHFQSVSPSKFYCFMIYTPYPSDSTCSYAFRSIPISCMHSKAILACNAQPVHGKKYQNKNPEHTPVENPWLEATRLALIHKLAARGWAVVTSPVGWAAPVSTWLYWPCVWPVWPSLMWMS